MASLGQAKTLGGVGSILILLTIVPTVGGILSIIGWILVLVAVKNVADTLGDNSIFSNMLIAAVLSIVGIIVATVVVLAVVFQFVGVGSAFTFTPGAAPPADFYALLASIVLGLIAVWVFYLVASIFLKKSYDSIALKTNIGTFHTSGLLFLIGAITTVILVGFIIILVAIILQIVAFFSLPEQLAQQQPTQDRSRPTPPAPPPLPLPQTI